MPWQNNSDGPWGGGGNKGGGRGPWGGGGNRGGSGGGNQPPNLEDLIRRGQERMKQVMPGGSIGPRGIVIVVVVAVIAWLVSGIYMVNADEQGIVKTFGAYSRQTGPGINYHLPWPIESVETPQVTAQKQINIGFDAEAGRDRSGQNESLILTGDENLLHVEFTVQWMISDAPAYLFNVENVEGTIAAVAESAMREVIGRSNQQRILTEDRPKIPVEVQQLMQSILDAYGTGVTIVQLNLQDVRVPGAVIEAFRDVQAAKADAERARNEAETYRNKTVPGAYGRAAQIKQDAEAYKAQTEAEAQGEAQRFLSVYEQYRLAPDVTRERIYLETMEKVLRGTDKIIVDDGANGAGVVPYLPLDRLRPNPAPPSSSPELQNPAGGR